MVLIEIEKKSILEEIESFKNDCLKKSLKYQWEGCPSQLINHHKELQIGFIILGIMFEDFRFEVEQIYETRNRFKTIEIEIQFSSSKFGRRSEEIKLVSFLGFRDYNFIDIYNELISKNLYVVSEFLIEPFRKKTCECLIVDLCDEYFSTFEEMWFMSK